MYLSLCVIYANYYILEPQTFSCINNFISFKCYFLLGNLHKYAVQVQMLGSTLYPKKARSGSLGSL